MNEIFNNMDDLFHELGNILNPKQNKLFALKIQAYDHLVAFKNMDSNNDNFWDYLKLIDSEIERLKELDFYPSWESEFITHSEKFYDSMSFKIFDRADKPEKVRARHFNYCKN